MSNISQKSIKELDDMYSVIRDSGTFSDKEFHSESAHDILYLLFKAISRHPEDNVKIIADFFDKYSNDLKKRSERVIRRSTT
jgi:hypothetical protein